MRERLERLWPSLVALLGTVAVVIGLLVLFGGDVEESTPDDVAAGEGEATDEPTGGDPSASPTPEPTTDETTPPPTDSDTPTAPETAPEEIREPVGVLNQTSVNGLASEAQARFQEGGWDVPATGDFQGTVQETTVFYPEGMKEAAEAFSRQFPDVARVEPSFEGLTQDRLVVILVEDYADSASGGTEGGGAESGGDGGAESGGDGGAESGGDGEDSGAESGGESGESGESGGESGEGSGDGADGSDSGEGE